MPLHFAPTDYWEPKIGILNQPTRRVRVKKTKNKDTPPHPPNFVVVLCPRSNQRAHSRPARFGVGCFELESSGKTATRRKKASLSLPFESQLVGSRRPPSQQAPHFTTGAVLPIHPQTRAPPPQTLQLGQASISLQRRRPLHLFVPKCISGAPSCPAVQRGGGNRLRTAADNGRRPRETIGEARARP